MPKKSPPVNARGDLYKNEPTEKKPPILKDGGNVMSEEVKTVVTEIDGKPVYENTCLKCGTAWNCYNCGKDVLKEPHEGFTGAILFDGGEQSSMAGPGEPAQFYIECKECFDVRTKK